MAAAQPIRNKKDIARLAGYLLKQGQPRNHLLVVLGACTALRVSDLLHLTWADVYDEAGGQFKTHLTLTEQKTGKQSVIALNRQALGALRLCFAYRRGPYLFAGRRKNGSPISRVQAWRIIRAAARAIGLDGPVCCHSLRKTFGYHAWKSGVSAVVIMDIFNHSSYEVTRRYLGVCQDDRDRAYMRCKLFQATAD
jgi:integrase